MGGHRKGGAPLAVILGVLLLLAQSGWLAGGICFRGGAGHGGDASASLAAGAVSHGPHRPHSDHGGHGDHGDHNGHPGHFGGTGAPSDGDSHGSHGDCDCLLDCFACGMGAPGGAPSKVVAGPFPPALASSSSAVGVLLVAPLQIPHLLPYPNGPPLLS